MPRPPPASREDLKKLGWSVRYVPHEVIEDYNATYNVEYEGRRITTSAAADLGIPRNEIWISERWRPYEEYILFHELREIHHRAIGGTPEEAHQKAVKEAEEAWGRDREYREMVRAMAETDVETARRKGW